VPCRPPREHFEKPKGRLKKRNAELRSRLDTIARAQQGKSIVMSDKLMRAMRSWLHPGKPERTQAARRPRAGIQFVQNPAA
jgi:hypothetical protein